MCLFYGQSLDLKGWNHAVKFVRPRRANSQYSDQKKLFLVIDVLSDYKRALMYTFV